MSSLSTDQRKEIVEFLKTRSILKLLELPILEGISPIFSETQYGPDGVVFKPGDPADALFIVREGTVEVIQGDPPKVIASITAGECFGEMSVIHDMPRTSTIRVPESATILRIPKAAVKELCIRYPELTTALAEVINRRNAGSLPFQVPGLQGNLSFFDLATVVQTVAASRQSGFLLFFGPSGKAVAKLTMKDGAMVQATFNHLSGEPAVLELITRTDPLDFVFKQRDVQKESQDPGLRLKPPHMLLMEGARRSDELLKLLYSVGWPDAVILQGEAIADWGQGGPTAEAIRSQVWPLLGARCTVQELTEQLPFDRYSILTVLDEMLKRRNATKSDEERIAPSLEDTRTMSAAERAAQLNKPVESKFRSAHPMELRQGASQVMAALNAINAVAANLVVIFGKNEVRTALAHALQQAIDVNPKLASLKIDAENPAIDMRQASSEVATGKDTVRSLEYVMRTLLQGVLRGMR